MSTYDLKYAIQACMIYLIMCIVDQSPESERIIIELLAVLHVSRNMLYHADSL